MKLLHKDIRHGVIKVKVDSNEDTWYLSHIIESGDFVSGTTERKVKIGNSDDKARIIKRVVFIKISVEKILYENDVLRVSGKIIEAPDDIPKGDYHTFNITEGVVITVEKKKFSVYALKKLDEAIKKDNYNILLVAFDREEALFAILKNNGYELLLHLKGDVTKKGSEEKKTNFYREIYSQISAYDEKYDFTNIIVASPAFWKDYLVKEISNDSIKRKITLATCSSVDNSAISEILRRPELKTVLEKDRSSKELLLVDQLLLNIKRDNAVYGFEQVKDKVLSGNISLLLLSENFIKKLKEQNDFDKLDEIMDSVESLNADIKIISSDNACKKLDGLSGIAAILRWKEHISL